MPQTERATRAARAGVAELCMLVREAMVALALQDGGPLPASVTPAQGPVGGAAPPSGPLGVLEAGWLAQASHGETAKARARRTPLTFHRTGTRDATDESSDSTRVFALVELAKRGDAEAFGQLYDHYLSTVYRYIYYRVGTHVLAEDLTSETFLRALRALSSFRWQGRDFGAWLVTIARNLVTDHFKSGRFRLEVATGEILDYDSAADGPEEDVLANLANEALIKAVKQLGADQQECLVLRFLNGLSVAETAQVLAKSEGAVKQLQLRAVRNLAKLLPEGIR